MQLQEITGNHLLQLVGATAHLGESIVDFWISCAPCLLTHHILISPREYIEKVHGNSQITILDPQFWNYFQMVRFSLKRSRFHCSSHSVQYQKNHTTGYLTAVLRRLEPIHNQPIFAIVLCNGCDCTCYFFVFNTLQGALRDIRL